MPIDCSASFVDASEACNGRVLICLKDLATQGPYFQGFDINGGNATGSAHGSTGFQSSNNQPPYAQDFAVTDVPGFQCFYVPYTVGSHNADVFVIQATDNSTTNACELSFAVPANSACSNTPDDDSQIYTCTNPQLQASAGQTLCISKADLSIPESTATPCIVTNIRFTPAITFIISDPACVAKIPAAQMTAANAPLVMTFDVFCNNVTQATDCKATINIAAAECPDPVIVECQNGQVALVQGVAKTLSVAGCECCDASEITWRSPDPQLTFNPANGPVTQVIASDTGNFTIEVECCKSLSES